MSKYFRRNISLRESLYGEFLFFTLENLPSKAIKFAKDKIDIPAGRLTMGYTNVCNPTQQPTITQNHPQPSSITHNHPQIPTITQTLPKKVKICHKQLRYCTLDVNTETGIDLDSDMKQCIYICICVCVWCIYTYFRRGYSVSKRLVKLTRFQCFPLQLSGNQGLPLCCVINFNTLVGYLSVQDQLKTAFQWKDSMP